MNLALWLKKHRFRPDQVQTFYPSPMALATAMYHSGRNPLKKLHYKAERLPVPRQIEQRRLHKAFLRYHDPANWPMLREALVRMGRADLIGNGDRYLVPPDTGSRTSRPPPRAGRLAGPKTSGQRLAEQKRSRMRKR